jgi:uncharacterized membrane protein YbhN (UPF0104 family)
MKVLTKINNKNSIAFRLLKMILTLFVGLLCYWQFKRLNIAELQQVNQPDWLWILLAFCLVVINYWFEFSKWNLILKSLFSTVGWSLKIQSFFAGIITGMITPNMQGNFLGRMYYFPKNQRVNITLLTLVANFGQFLVTMILGLIALLFLHETKDYFVFYSLIIALLILFYFYFERINWLQKKFKWFRRIALILQKNKLLRWQFLTRSIGRNFIFSLQLMLILKSFGAPFSWETYMLIWKLYLFITLSPSLFLGKLIIRESISLYVLSPLLLQEWSIVFSSLIIWVINLLIPTIIGLFVSKKSNRWN